MNIPALPSKSFLACTLFQSAPIVIEQTIPITLGKDVTSHFTEG